MKENSNFNIPNILTIFRLVLSISLYFIWKNNLLLFTIIVVIGITDIIDGYIARKLNQETNFGAWLDSIADFIFFIALILCAIVYEYKIIWGYKIYIIIIILIKLLSIIICLIKYKKLGLLHTSGNKITGIILFIGICLLVLIKLDIIILIGLYVSIIFSLEELLINIFGKEYKENIKGIYEIKNKIVPNITR